MKILFTRPRAELGGVARHMLLLAGALTERGHEVSLATASGSWLSRFSSTYTLPLYPSLPHNFALSVVLMHQLVRTQRIEIIHSHHRFSTMVGRIVSRLTNVPLICTVHEFKFNWRPLAGFWLAPAVCAPSEALRDYLLQYYDVQPERVVVVKLGPVKLTPSSLPPKTEFASALVVGYIGRLAPEKGVSTLIRALPEVFRACTQARAIIVGDGIERPRLEMLAKKCAISERLEFVGDQSDTTFWLAKMTVVVLPSLTESFGLAAAEAMAFGLPVVASRVGGLPELIDDGVTGFLVPENNPDVLAQRIIELLTQPDRVRAMGFAGQQKAAQWSPARAAEITEAIYRREIAHRRN